MSARAHPLRVFEVVKETAEAVTVVFDIPPELADRFAYSPGQFLTLEIPGASEGPVARCYSLSSSPHCDRRPAITVKRVAGGHGSNWICDNIAVDSVLTVLEPSGTFVAGGLHDDLLLCAGGSGITPVVSIAKSVLMAGTGHVTLFYANRDVDAVIFRAEIDELAARFPERFTVVHWLEIERGLPTAAGIAAELAGSVDAEVYLCGPTGFADQVRGALAQLNVAEDRLHIEKYRSLDTNPFAAEAAPVVPVGDGGAQVRVDLDGESYSFTWPKETPLLDVLLAAGLDPPHVCRESACGTCVCSVKSGRTRMLLNESLIDEEIGRGLTLACQTLPESDTVHIAFDQ